ncbi:MAG: DUF4147 domain-containing protein [Bacteroidetes bacterium]|nr:DUF4147 domain-containing protein [Bacteroidota bacterium]
MKAAVDSSAETLLQRLVESSICAVKPITVFENNCRLSGNNLTAFGHTLHLEGRNALRCVAIGKSAEAMALEIQKRLGDRVNGIIATPIERHLGVKGFKFFKTGHPYSDKESLKAGDKVRQFVSSCRATDMLLFLISGGGSASVFVPVEGVSLDDANHLIKAALDSGVPIHKLNLLRRHLSALGGGKLAALAKKANKLSLVISDVVGDHLPSIASGPTVPDNTTPADAYDFLVESGLIAKINESIPNALRSLSEHFRGINLENNAVRVIASNSNALSAAENEGIENGFNTLVLTRFLEMDAESAAGFLVSIARSVEQDGIPVPPPALVLTGGETTVNVKGPGKGGRNQHLVLSALRELVRLKEGGVNLNRTTVFSFGTDGKDGNSSAAGAFASAELLARFDDGGKEIQKYFNESDSNSFFTKHGGLISTGPTDTNVMDISGIIVA